MKKIYRWLVPLAISGTALLGVTAAHAAKPAQQACLGETISVPAGDNWELHQMQRRLAQNGFGHGMGTEVQIALSGQLSDEVAPNTCND